MNKFKFGPQRLAVWYSTEHDYFTIDKEDWWKHENESYVVVSEPFDCEIKELDGAVERVTEAKVSKIDDKIAEHLVKIDYLKDQKARLLALPCPVEDGETND